MVDGWGKILFAPNYCPIFFNRSPSRIVDKLFYFPGGSDMVLTGLTLVSFFSETLLSSIL